MFREKIRKGRQVNSNIHIKNKLPTLVNMVKIVYLKKVSFHCCMFYENCKGSLSTLVELLASKIVFAKMQTGSHDVQRKSCDPVSSCDFGYIYIFQIELLYN